MVWGISGASGGVFGVSGFAGGVTGDDFSIREEKEDSSLLLSLFSCFFLNTVETNFSTPFTVPQMQDILFNPTNLIPVACLGTNEHKTQLAYFSVTFSMFSWVSDSIMLS